MKILVLGGTQFVGRHFCEVALAAGHELTLVHRGKTGAGLFPEATHVLTDRLLDLSMLSSERYDAILDVNAYFPRAIRIAIEALKQTSPHYVFISTISTYDRDATSAFIDENTKMQELADPTVEEITGETYGGLKVLCERELTANWPGKLTFIRPGIIFGRYDHTNRFHQWVRMILQDDVVAVPMRSEQPLQAVDGGDLARFTLKTITDRIEGDFNVCGPASPITFGEVLEIIKKATGKTPELVPTELEKIEVKPLVFSQDGSGDTMFKVSNAKAISAGLVFSPLVQTISEIAAEITPKD